MTTLDNVLALEIERRWTDGIKAIGELYDTAEDARQRWVRIGHGLLAGRQKCPADQEFGAWVERTRYGNINRNERQDAMWLALNAAVAIPALRETRIENPSWARQHIRENLPGIYGQCQEVRVVTQACVTTAKVDEAPESHQEATTAGPEPVAAESESTFSGADMAKPRRIYPTGEGDQPVHATGKLKLPKHIGTPAEDVLRVCEAYPQNRQKVFRAELAKMPAAAALRMFKLALATVDAGTAPDLSNLGKLDARMFWPHLPEGFCRVPLSALTLPQWDKKRDKLTEIDAEMARLRGTNASDDLLYDTAHSLWSGQPIASPASGLTKPKADLPPDSKLKHKVVFCDAQLWPRADYPQVVEDDVIEGWNFASLWIRRLSVGIGAQKPREIAVMLRHLSNDLAGAASLQGFLTVLRECIAAYDKVDGDKESMLRNVTPGRRIKHE